MRNAKGFLDPRETFEHYENRSRPTSSQSFEPPGAGGASHGRLACEYRQAPPAHSAGSNGVLACEYRAGAAPGSHGVMACEYRAPPSPAQYPGVLACDYRAAPPDARYRIDDTPQRFPPTPKITTYFPESNKRKVPLGVVIAVAIGLPVVLILCLFGAVWLQELGIL